MIHKSHAEVGIGVGTLLGSEVVRQTQDLLKFCKGLTIFSFKKMNIPLAIVSSYKIGVYFNGFLVLDDSIIILGLVEVAETSVIIGIRKVIL